MGQEGLGRSSAGKRGPFDTAASEGITGQRQGKRGVHHQVRFCIAEFGLAVAPTVDLKGSDSRANQVCGRCEQNTSAFKSVVIPMLHAEGRRGV